MMSEREGEGEREREREREGVRAKLPPDTTQLRADRE